MSIPTTQKAAVFDEPGKVSTQVVDLPVPEPGPGEVLVNLYVGSTFDAPKLIPGQDTLWRLPF